VYDDDTSFEFISKSVAELTHAEVLANFVKRATMAAGTMVAGRSMVELLAGGKQPPQYCVSCWYMCMRVPPARTSNVALPCAHLHLPLWADQKCVYVCFLCV
jgi:hypothetical protein